MNWEAIGAISDGLGALGVIVGLVYLALQVRNGSNVAKAQMFQARAQMSEDRHGQLVDSPYLAEIYLKLKTERRAYDPAKVDELTSEQVLRLRHYELRWRRAFENIIQQHALGLIPDDFLQEMGWHVRQKYDLWQRIDLPPVRDAIDRFLREAADGREPNSRVAAPR